MNDKKKLHKYKLMNILSNIKNDKILLYNPFIVRIFLFK